MSHAPVEASHYQGADLQHAKATAELNRRVDEGTSWSGNERNQVFLNLGLGEHSQNLPRFADISAVAGFDFPDDSRALISLDWDHDGDLDFVTTNRTAPRMRLLQNTLPHRPDSFLFVKLTGTQTNRDAIGSRVTLHLDHKGRSIALDRTLRAGEGFLSQSSRWLHFGIPKGARVKDLVVHWHGHPAQAFSGLVAGKSYELVQNDGPARVHSFPEFSPLTGRPPSPETPSALIHLERPLPLPRLPYLTLDGGERSLTSAQERPTVLTLWATWCPDCLQELREFSRQTDTFRSSGFDVLALCVDLHDQPENLAKANAILKETGFPFEAGIATAKTLELIHLSHNNLFLRPSKLPVPTTLILGSQAKWHSLARGPVTPDELDPVLSAISRPRSWSDFARPAGPGIWQHGPGVIPYSGIAKEMLDRGWLEDAARYLLERRNDLLADGIIYPELLMAVGTRLLAEEKRMARGIALLEAAVETAPELAAAQNNLAVAYLQTGESERAARHLEAALALDPAFADARLNLARYHLEIEDADSAQRLIAPILEDDYHPKAMRLQARIHLLKRNFTALLPVFRTITENEPGDPGAWINLAKLHQQNKENEAATVAFEKAVRLLPENHPQRQSLRSIIEQLQRSPN